MEDTLRVDFEKKELKKIEQNNTDWSEEDEKLWLDAKSLAYEVEDRNLASWIISIKNRIQPQPKRGWSEEDEKMYAAVLQLITDSEKENGWNCVYCNDKEIYFSDIIAWLKRRYTWKPSDEQMEALEHFIVYHNGSTNYAKDLEELRLQLKKLREE